MIEVNIDGVAIAVKQEIIREERPTIIFLHDSLGCIELWRDFPQAICEMTDCNQVVYDRRGYGRSAPFASIKRTNSYLEDEADFLQQLIKAMGIQRPILFGHSDGGSIALIAASKYPADVTAIITEGAHIFVEEITLTGIRHVADAYRETDLKQKLQKYHGDKTEEVFAAWADTWLHPQFRSWNIENFLPGIGCPALIIQGEQDEYGSIAQVNGIINQVSGYSEELLLPSTGHTPHKQAREAVLLRAAAFIKRVIGDAE